MDELLITLNSHPKCHLTLGMIKRYMNDDNFVAFFETQRCSRFSIKYCKKEIFNIMTTINEIPHYLVFSEHDCGYYYGRFTKNIIDLNLFVKDAHDNLYVVTQCKQIPLSYKEIRTTNNEILVLIVVNFGYEDTIESDVKISHNKINYEWKMV